ncbi:MAG: hypothetical protein ACJ76H_04575 [Bacteriovoracaceae bacterium]
MKIFMLTLGLFIAVPAIAQEPPKTEPKVIYQYKKYEKFDLGNLEVKGQLIAPGDISVRERERKRFELDLFNRRKFDTFQRKDLESLR